MGIMGTIKIIPNITPATVTPVPVRVMGSRNTRLPLVGCSQSERDGEDKTLFPITLRPLGVCCLSSLRNLFFEGTKINIPTLGKKRNTQEFFASSGWQARQKFFSLFFTQTWTRPCVIFIFTNGRSRESTKKIYIKKITLEKCFGSFFFNRRRNDFFSELLLFQS